MTETSAHRRPMRLPSVKEGGPLLLLGVAGVAVFGAMTIAAPAMKPVWGGIGLGLFAVAVCLWFARSRHRVFPSARMSLLQGIVDADPWPGVVTTRDGRLSVVNTPAAEMLGLSVGTFLSSALEHEMVSARSFVDRMLAGSEVSRESLLIDQTEYAVTAQHVGKNMILWRFVAPPSDDRERLKHLSLPVLFGSRTVGWTAINKAAERAYDPMLSLSAQGIPSIAGHAEHVLSDTGDRQTILYFPENGTTHEPASATLGDISTMDALIEGLPVPILRIAPQGAIEAANAPARRLLCLEPGASPPLWEIVEGMGRSVSDWLADAVNARGLMRPEFVRASLPDKDVYLQIVLGQTENEDGMQLIGILNDATELKTLEAQFVQSQKMQAIGQLAGGVAHDFNNLLTAISGHCDLLLLRHDQGDPDYSDLKQIGHNANRASSLVGQLLAFSRKQALKAQPLDLHETMSDLTHLLNRLVGERVTLSLEIAPLDKVIRADRRGFEQVIMNLVVNARDAMPEGGPVAITVEELRLGEPLERDRAILEPGDYIVVEVSDRGVGIEPERLPKIFEPFYTTKKQGEGTGLGLSTAYGIVKQSGGFIFADSEVGKGTRFTLMFPAHAREAVIDAPVPPPRKATSSVPHSGVVLLVEDEAPVRAFASRALRLRGYTVLEADDAEAALEILSDRTLHIDVFVTDVIMPGLDGPTWVRHALEDRPDTRVVFVSGYSEESLSESQSRVPNSVFLAKPFSLTQLTDVVQEQLS